jgi:hypothetical protein
MAMLLLLQHLMGCAISAVASIDQALVTKGQSSSNPQLEQ